MSRGKALVTGAEGFIGSHLVGHLIRQGWEVRAFVLYNSFQSIGWLSTLEKEERRSVEIFMGDIRDRARVDEALQGVDVVFHLAALITIPYSYLAAESYLDVNVKGTLHLLEAIKKQGRARFLLMSSSEVYGTAREVPIAETHPLQAQSPYSASKIAAEALATSYMHSFGFPLTILRAFNNYGPRQSLRAVIPSLIIQLLRKQKEIKLGNPHPTRDFLYVSDHVEALEMVAQKEETLGQILNIATGHEISIGKLAEKLIEMIHPQATLLEDPQRLRPSGSEVERLCGDAFKLRKITGWIPAHSLNQGLKATIEWYAQPGNQALYEGDYAI